MNLAQGRLFMQVLAIQKPHEAGSRPVCVALVAFVPAVDREDGMTQFWIAFGISCPPFRVVRVAQVCLG
jgi:hypothetical protein